MLTNIWDSVKEFLKLDSSTRSLLFSYLFLGGIIYFQYRVVESYKAEKEDYSRSVYERQLKNDDHCQQLLLNARNKYQDNLETTRDEYQTKLDSLSDIVLTMRQKYRNDNIKLSKKINENN